jgi:hypothetical protein
MKGQGVYYRLKRSTLVEDKVFELISRMYAEMQDGFKGLGKEIVEIKQDVSGLKQDIIRIKNKMQNTRQTESSG